MKCIQVILYLVASFFEPINTDLDASAGKLFRVPMGHGHIGPVNDNWSETGHIGAGAGGPAHIVTWCQWL